MSKITFSDKVALNENASIPDINKMKAADVNEIKTIVNANSPEEIFYIVTGTLVLPQGQRYVEDDIELSSDMTYDKLAIITAMYGYGVRDFTEAHQYFTASVSTTIRGINYLTINYHLPADQSVLVEDRTVYYKVVLLKLEW